MDVAASAVFIQFGDGVCCIWVPDGAGAFGLEEVRGVVEYGAWECWKQRGSRARVRAER